VNITTLAIWIPLALVVLVAVRALLDKLTASASETDDIALFARRVDLSLLEELLDPEAEAQLRKQLSSPAFRRLQRKRIMAACEQIKRISHNADVLLNWASRQYSKIADKGRAHFDATDLLIAGVIESAVRVKSDAWWAVLKLRFWRATLMQLWPFLPSPSLSDLREVYGHDLLQAYESLTSSAGELLLALNDGNYDRVRAAL
jgi:hypothetical protein